MIRLLDKQTADKIAAYSDKDFSHPNCYAYVAKYAGKIAQTVDIF